MRKLLHKEKGFTLVELLVVVGIITTLFGMITISLVKTHHTASVSATVDELVSDLRTQQTKAMIGAIDTTGSANSYGIHILANSYILFQGTSDLGGSSDYTVSPDGITFATNLPNTSSIVFDRRSGTFTTGYVNGTTYTITVSDTYGTEQKKLTINKYGVVTNIQ